MLYLSTFAAAESFVVLIASGKWLLVMHQAQTLGLLLTAFLSSTGEIWEAWEHSMRHTDTIPSICAFSVLGYVTVCLILLIIKGFGATNAEIVKSLRKVGGN